MFHMPMSSPMMKTMLGFLPCAYAPPRLAKVANNASAMAHRPRVQRRSVVGLFMIDSFRVFFVRN